MKQWRARYISRHSIDANYKINHRLVIVSEAIEEIILLKNRDDPFKSSLSIKKELELSVSARTVEHALHKNGIMSYPAATNSRLIDRQRMRRQTIAEELIGQSAFSSMSRASLPTIPV